MTRDSTQLEQTKQLETHDHLQTKGSTYDSKPLQRSSGCARRTRRQFDGSGGSDIVVFRNVPHHDHVGWTGNHRRLGIN